MRKLIMMRHGQSLWNLANQFTGWVDVPLSELGVQEAMEGGRQIAHLPIDVIYTSTLIRAQMTAMLAMLHHHSGKTPVVVHDSGDQQSRWSGIYSPKAKGLTIPVYTAWQLNERMYGRLQGLNKAETAEEYGPVQVKIWRRSYDVSPPEGESLEQTAARTLPYFHEVIIPALEEGKNVFVAAHGNSIRSMVMKLDGLSNRQVVELEIPTGKPLIYEFAEGVFSKVAI